MGAVETGGQGRETENIAWKILVGVAVCIEHGMWRWYHDGSELSTSWDRGTPNRAYDCV